MDALNHLEAYSRNHPDQVLLVTAAWAETPDTTEEDVVMIFKGFSSSLMRPTAADPDIPVLPPQARIISIDRLASPYRPHNPHYLEQNLSWPEFFARYGPG